MADGVAGRFTEKLMRFWKKHNHLVEQHSFYNRSSEDAVGLFARGAYAAGSSPGRGQSGRGARGVMR